MTQVSMAITHLPIKQERQTETKKKSHISKNTHRQRLTATFKKKNPL